MTGVDGLRIRDAVRALVVDEHERVLLVRFEFPAGTRWALPGGGIDPGETPREALRRELAEELGLHDPDIGAHLWNRLHIVPFINGHWDGQREQIYEVVVASGFEPQPLFSWEQLNAEYLFEIRWWTPDDIEAAELHTAPRALARLVRNHFRDGPPPEPFDVDP